MHCLLMPATKRLLILPCHTCDTLTVLQTRLEMLMVGKIWCYPQTHCDWRVPGKARAHHLLFESRGLQSSLSAAVRAYTVTHDVVEVHATSLGHTSVTKCKPLCIMPDLKLNLNPVAWQTDTTSCGMPDRHYFRWHGRHTYYFLWHARHTYCFLWHAYRYIVHVLMNTRHTQHWCYVYLSAHVAVKEVKQTCGRPSGS